MGKELALPFIAMTEWGDKWLGGDGERPLVLRSRANGQTLRVALVDERGRVAEPADVEIMIARKVLRRTDVPD
jgi:hypothetical protein